MPNIDELSHDMTFTVGGETFLVHDVPPNVIEEWDTEDDEIAATETAHLEALARGEEPAASGNGKKPETLMQRLDRRVTSFLTPEDAKKYKVLRARKVDQNPVPAWKIVAFYNSLMETQTGRPTRPPSSSQPGAGQTARSSGGA